MNVNIYYGGRGLVDDPTIVVINRIQEVLEELNVHVTRYNLYEIKNTITTLSQSVVEADGVVFATTVEWVGMGGYMQTLLDSCWLYADKSRTSSTYMFPVVMSRAYGEREVVTALSNSWEIIGGVVGESLSAYADKSRTSIYRYSFKQSETVSCTLSDIINNINEYIKSRYNGLIALDTSNISLECSSASIYASSHYLNIALKEIIVNAGADIVRLVNRAAVIGFITSY